MSQRYEIREQIGKGGLGAVYKAFDTQLHREVAMKRVLSTEHATEEEVRAAAMKLIGEAKTLSTLNHPNIVTVFDVGQDEKGGFVVMELLKGETLDDTVSRGVLTQEDFIEIVNQTMEALIAAQASDVLHRDLKPTNVMVIWQPSGKFQTKILDFGLAKFSRAPSVQTMDQEDAVMGSIFFMAPEQFERSELDGRTDLYQMGCVYYFSLTGQYPFRGDTGPQVMNAHLQHRVVPLDKLRPDLSPSICQWVMWLINRDLANRPAHARDALERFPKNPEPPSDEPVLQAIVVEDPPQGVTTGVQVVLPKRSAAPPSLVVGKKGVSSDSTTVPRGTTGPRRQATGPIRDVEAPPKSRKPLFIGIGVGLILVAGTVGWVTAKKMKANSERTRLVQLAGQEAPAGSVDDFELAIKFLESKDATAEQKTGAIKLLSTLSGEGVEGALMETLKTSPSSYVRLKLAQAAGDRGLTAAVSSILAASSGAPSDSQKAEFLNSVRRVADASAIPALLQALARDEHGPGIRKQFEDIIISIHRRNPSDKKLTNDLLAKLATTKDVERRSICRILGAFGNDEVMGRLKTIYGAEGEKSLRYDAVNALMNWPDRSALPLVEQILTSQQEPALKIAAARAYARLTGLPAALPIAEKVEAWKKGFGYITRSQDAKRLFSAMAENPSPEVKALLQEQSASETHGATAKALIQQIDQTLAKAPEIASGGDLAAANTLLGGEDQTGAVYLPDAQAITGWRSPDTWFLWHFKVKEAGAYGVEILQSYPFEGVSEFVVIIGEHSLAGKSVTTPSHTDFVPVTPTGVVALEPGKVHTLILAARGTTQPLMMNLRTIKLVKR